MEARSPHSAARGKGAAAAGEGGEVPAWFLVASPGLEEVAKKEVDALTRDLALRHQALVAGGVEFVGPTEDVRRLLPRLRIATRVWRRLGSTRARAFGEVERKWGALPWRDFIALEQAVRVEVTVHRCRLHHTGALRQRMLQAIGAALGRPVPSAFSPASDGAEGDGKADDDASHTLRVLVRGEDDVFTVSVDASGDRLNVRGYREEIGRAPLRETLAAGLLALCAWSSDEPLVDPMCGSGTLPIEAALQALGRLPPRRHFAMDHWPCRRSLPAAHDVMGPRSDVPVRIWASDKDAQMTERARRNAMRAGVDQAIAIAAADFETLKPPAPSGLLLFNPPYGHRMGAHTRSWSRLGEALTRSWRGWRAGLLLPAGADLRAPGLTVLERHPLRNGGLATELVKVRM